MFGTSVSPLGFGSVTSSQTQQQQQQLKVSDDYQFPPAVTDTVSSLNFSPNSNYIAATTWSNQVLLWELGQAQPGVFQAVPKSQTEHELPLDSNWVADGTKIVTGGGDCTVKVWDLQSGQQAALGKHDAAVRAVCPLSPNAGSPTVVASGGFDGKVKYWDMRTNGAVGEVQLSAKITCMDTRNFLLVAGLFQPPDRTTKNVEIQVLDLRKPTVLAEHTGTRFELTGPTSNPANKGKGVEQVAQISVIRSVQCFPDAEGYMVGSVEGRVGVQNFKPYSKEHNQPQYTFKCHRRELNFNGEVVEKSGAKPTSSTQKNTYEEVYAVNVIRFNPATGTFVTCGSDGWYYFWDKNEKSRLSKPSKGSHMPITAASYHSSGQWLAYAVGTDWSQGHMAHDPSNQNLAPAVRVHQLTPEQMVKNKNKTR